MVSYNELMTTQNAVEQNIENRQSPHSVMQGGLPSLVNATVTQNQSALRTIDRFKYGFADDMGKRKIIQDAGYTPNQIVPLRNGEYGVKIPGVGIRPVDPKGFQLSDMASDIAESVGGAMPTIGMAVGGSMGTGVGTIPMAGAGGAAGEYMRQKVGDLLGVRTPGMSNQDYNEIAAQAVFGAGGQTIALGGSVLLKGLLKAGSNVMGATAGDTTRVTTKVSNILADSLGFKNTNDEILARGLHNPRIPVVEHVDDLAAQTNIKLTDFVENKNKLLFQQFIEPELQKVAGQQGVNNLDDVILDTAPTVKELQNILTGLNSKKLLASQKAEIKPLIQEHIDMLKGTPVFKNGQMVSDESMLTYGQFKEVMNNTYKLGQAAGDAGQYAKADAINDIYDAFVKSRAQTLSPEAFSQYSKERAVLGKLDQLFKVKLDNGEITPGRLTLVGKLARFADKTKQGPNYDLLQKTIQEAKDIGLPGANELGDSVDSFLFNYAASQAKSTPGTLGKIARGIPIVNGMADVATTPLTSPVNRLRVLKGLINTGVLDASKLDASVAEFGFPRANALGQLINAKRMIDQGTPLGAVLKMVPKELAFAIRKIKPGLPGAIIGQSLNNIVYGGNK